MHSEVIFAAVFSLLIVFSAGMSAGAALERRQRKPGCGECGVWHSKIRNYTQAVRKLRKDGFE